jgi:hypothetical protein
MLGNFLKNTEVAQIFWATRFHSKSFVLIFSKYFLGYFLGNFSQTRLVTLPLTELETSVRVDRFRKMDQMVTRQLSSIMTNNRCNRIDSFINEEFFFAF